MFSLTRVLHFHFVCEEQLPQSQPGLFSTFGPVVSNTTELATSAIGFHIRTAPFQF